MKGQIFLIASILILIGLIMLRINTVPFVQDPETHLQDHFLNIKNELIKTVDKSLLSGEALSSKLDRFISFSKQVLKERGFDQEIKYDITTLGEETIVTFDISINNKDSKLNDKIIIKRRLY